MFRGKGLEKIYGGVGGNLGGLEKSGKTLGEKNLWWKLFNKNFISDSLDFFLSNFKATFYGLGL